MKSHPAAGDIGDADRRIDGDLGQGTALAGDRDNRRKTAC